MVQSKGLAPDTLIVAGSNSVDAAVAFHQDVAAIDCGYLIDVSADTSRTCRFGGYASAKTLVGSLAWLVA